MPAFLPPKKHKGCVERIQTGHHHFGECSSTALNFQTVSKFGTGVVLFGVPLLRGQREKKELPEGFGAIFQQSCAIKAPAVAIAGAYKSAHFVPVPFFERMEQPCVCPGELARRLHIPDKPACGGKKNAAHEGKNTAKSHGWDVLNSGWNETAFCVWLPGMVKYRSNVAFILEKEDGRILICERSDILGAWQFPQGGVDAGETLEEALFREVMEEISLEPTDYSVIERKGPYRYEFGGGRTKKGFGGQEQTYFRARFLGEDSLILAGSGSKEFRAARWIRPEQFRLSWVASMKRDVYRAVFQNFFGINPDHPFTAN